MRNTSELTVLPSLLAGHPAQSFIIPLDSQTTVMKQYFHESLLHTFPSLHTFLAMVHSTQNSKSFNVFPPDLLLISFTLTIQISIGSEYIPEPRGSLILITGPCSTISKASARCFDVPQSNKECTCHLTIQKIAFDVDTHFTMSYSTVALLNSKPGSTVSLPGT